MKNPATYTAMIEDNAARISERSELRSFSVGTAYRAMERTAPGCHPDTRRDAVAGLRRLAWAVTRAADGEDAPTLSEALDPNAFTAAGWEVPATF